jgi:NADH-quinone oxidoreductase subunit J
MNGVTAAVGTDGSLFAPLGTPEGVIFAILALGIVGLAIFCMTRHNPVTAVMSLVGTFFGLAAMYATLSAHFLAVIQVLVYAGAIMVLFIFVVMIVNREESTLVSLRGLPTRVVGLGFAVYLAWVFFRIAIPETPAAPPIAVSDAFGTVASVGDILFRQFLFPFEAISLLLLVAIVGGVVVSRSHRKEADATEAAEKRIAIAHLSSHDYPAVAAVEEGAGAAADEDPHAGRAAGGHH